MNRPEPGQCVTIKDGLRVVLAPNPGPMTHWGTNTFILGEGEVAIVDPGPRDLAHLDALLSATRGEIISHILVTHAHSDHSALCVDLARVTGATVLAFGPPDAGRRAVMSKLADGGMLRGGEGVDAGFRPHATLGDGERLEGPNWSVRAVHTPGHFAGHLAFDLGDAVLSGDHVMDWSSPLVSPPDGDLCAFMATSRMLLGHADKSFHPSHGGALGDPAARLEWLIAHRTGRETAILNALSSEPRNIPAITRTVYRDIPEPMLAAAERNVLAHLIDLIERNLVRAEPTLTFDADFRLS